MLTALAVAAAAIFSANPPCGGVLAVYYGGNAADYQRIANSPIEYLVSADVASVATEAPIVHPSGVKLLAYIRTCYANCGVTTPGVDGCGTTCAQGYPATPAGDLATVKGEVDQAMANGADGVMFDEATATAVPGTIEGNYYGTLYSYVKSHYGAGKTVVTNPGTGSIDESTLGVADVVGLECSWDSTQFAPAWKSSYSPRRFMGLDGDCRPASGAAQALTDALAAKANGVGFFYATDLYVDLPSWYETYVAELWSNGLCQGAPDGGTADGGPAVDALFLAAPGGSAPLASVQAGGRYDLFLKVSDPNGFAALAFADLWWSAPGVTEGTASDRGGRYLPGENYVVSDSLSDQTLWAAQTAGSSATVNITGQVGLYADGTTYRVDPDGGTARVTITLPAAPTGAWTLQGFVQRPPYASGLQSPLHVGTFEVVASGSSGGAPGGGSGGGSSSGGSADHGAADGGAPPSTPAVGGCGCSAASGSASGGLLGIGLVALALRRKRGSPPCAMS
ncbi:MAG: spherulation-specific family 4 protein [Deltaproteobacteria bacterium]